MSTTETTSTETSQVTVHFQDAAPQQSPLSGLPFILIMIGIFYFILIRPQQKEQKRHQTLLEALHKGQKVVTGSGVHGRVDEVSETEAVLEIASGVKVTVDKTSIKRVVGED